MTVETKKLLDEALQLPPAEREALAGQLFDSLETADPVAETAWQAASSLKEVIEEAAAVTGQAVSDFAISTIGPGRQTGCRGTRCDGTDLS